MKTILFWFVLLKAYRIIHTLAEDNLNADSCEQITGECADQGYSHTKIDWANANSFSSQQAADAKIKSYEILMPCSKYLKIFLCASYKPSCYTEGGRRRANQHLLLVRPCRSMCMHVYSRCYPLMEKFKRKWSIELNCSRFLDDSSNRCMRDPDGYSQDSLPDAVPFKHHIDSLFVTQTNTTRKNRLYKSTTKKTICNGKHNRSDKCYLRCDYDVEFSRSQKQISRIADLVINVLSLLTCSSSVFVYLIRKRNVNVDDSFLLNSFFYSSISIIGYSLTQIIGLTVGVENLACEKLKLNGANRPAFVIYSNQSFDNPFCSFTLLIAYYFSSSLLTRWLTLALFWYVLVKRQLDPLELDRVLRNYLNAFAFIAPAIQTFILLAIRYAEVFELSGLCTLGVHDVDMALKFIVLPSSAYSITGLLFVLAGYKSILALKLRDHSKQFSKFITDHNVIRKGFLIFLSSIPIIVILGCQLWEYVIVQENKQDSNNLKLGIFVAKNLLYFISSLFILTLTCSLNRQQVQQNSQQSTLYDTNETSDTIDSSSSSFEKKLTYAEQIMCQTEPRNLLRGKCACRANKAAFNRALLNAANRSMTLSESFIRLPETPTNEHHYCTPNLTAYECIVNSNNSSWQKHLNTSSRLVQERNVLDQERSIKLMSVENRSSQNSKFI